MFGKLTITTSFILLLSTTITGDSETETEDASSHRKFGSERPSQPVKEVEGFPAPITFFEKYVFPSVPVKMTNAARNFPAFKLWDDEYFLQLQNIPEDEEVTVETRKKENRTQPPTQMHFKEFVLVYNDTDQYMVNMVPSFLRKDVTMPAPLQCEDIMKNGILTEAMMWYSSGGTKSVVHTDSVDNINCLFRGQKELIFIDPKYRDKIDMDHPEGAYMGVDVDSVDYEKYPGLAEVEFLHVNVTAGDCLYIPYKWVHQVRSYNRNIAVNVWWDHFRNEEVDFTRCRPYDEGLTLDKAKFGGWGNSMDALGVIQDHFIDITSGGKQFNFEKLMDVFTGSMGVDELDIAKDSITFYLKKVFEMFDKDRNGLVNSKEVQDVTKEDWKLIQKALKNVEALLTRLEQEMGENPPEEIDGNEGNHDEL